jgi:hypothetical protein
MSIAGSSAAPWLTVVMPSHCGERWIDYTLQSLVREAAQGIEVLLIDSSPTSATRDIAQAYSKSLAIRIFERRDLLSWQAKTNFCVEMAKSDHVSWLGVDDLWLPGRAASARGWINSDPMAPVHFAPSAIIDIDNRKLGLWRCPLPAERALLPTFVTERLLIQNFVAAPAPVFRKAAWLTCGGLDENLWYTADWDMWLKLAACAPTYYHTDITIGFRVHARSLTMTGTINSLDFTRQMTTVLDRHLSKEGRDLSRVERAGRASIRVNVALASASADVRGLFHAAIQVALLGPIGIWKYFRDSRIVERVVARIRAKIAGRFTV